VDGLATLLEIQDGGRRHVGFSINANNCGLNGHTSTKVGGFKRATWSDCKPEVKFQYGRRLFSQIGSSNNSAVD